LPTPGKDFLLIHKIVDVFTFHFRPRPQAYLTLYSSNIHLFSKFLGYKVARPATSHQGPEDVANHWSSSVLKLPFTFFIVLLFYSVIFCAFK
jgi:hypothetical protein